MPRETPPRDSTGLPQFPCHLRTSDSLPGLYCPPQGIPSGCQGLFPPSGSVTGAPCRPLGVCFKPCCGSLPRGLALTSPHMCTCSSVLRGSVLQKPPAKPLFFLLLLASPPPAWAPPPAYPLSDSPHGEGGHSHPSTWLFHGGTVQLSIVSSVGHLWPWENKAHPARSSLANPSSIKYRNLIPDTVS